MRIKRIVLVIILALQVIFTVRSAVAQVPPHQPGTICYTPQFWCWMQNPGWPGAPCYCPTPYGPVGGITG